MISAPVPTNRQYDCAHEAEQAGENRKLTNFSSYNKACLLLCMTSYADTRELPDSSDSSTAYRDSIRSNPVTNPTLKISTKEAWPKYYQPNDNIIVEYFRKPAGYVRNVKLDSLINGRHE